MQSGTVRRHFLFAGNLRLHEPPSKALKIHRDQQNKERLLRAYEKCKKELHQIHSTSCHHSQRNFFEHSKVSYREVQMGQSFSLWKETTPMLSIRDRQHRVDRGSRYHSHVTSREDLHDEELSKKRPYKDPQKQTYAGDLLEKHADYFTKVKKPFKPRLLKKSASSFLVQSQYYKAPPRKSPKQHPEAHSREEDRLPADASEPLENVTHAPPTERENLGTHSRLLQQDSDLKYLQFLKELTEDILRGGGSSSVIDRVFEDHLGRRDHDIPRVKKKELMQELKKELEKPEKLDFSISYVGTLYGTEDFFTSHPFSF